MADKELINSIGGYNLAEESQNSPIYRASENQMADILAQPIDYDAISRSMSNSEALAREAGDYHTWRSNANLEQAIAGPLSDFEAKQTNAMVSAAEMISDAEVASQVANRKIDNLQQQKQVNNQIVESTEKFANAMNLPPVVGTIAGLFDDDYSVGKQFANLARDYTQLNNLQKQDALDDQLVLQHAFGQAGYNPLANDVINPAREWEKQYVDEVATLERNKINAMQNKINAKNGALDAFKALNTRLGTLQDIRHDRLASAGAIFSGANQRALGNQEERMRQLTVANDMANREFQRDQNAEDLAYRYANLEQSERNRATNEAIAKQESADRAMQRSLAYDQLVMKEKEIEDAKASRASQQKLAQLHKEKDEINAKLERERLELGRQQAANTTRELDLREQGRYSPSKKASSGSTSEGSTSAPTFMQAKEIFTKAGGVASKYQTLYSGLPSAVQMNNSAIMNSSSAGTAKNFYESYSLLTRMMANPEFNDKINSDGTFAQQVSQLAETVEQSGSALANETKSLLNPDGNKQGAIVTDVRLSHGGVIDDNNVSIARDYIITSDKPTADYATLEGQLGEGFKTSLTAFIVDSLTKFKADNAKRYKELFGDDEPSDLANRDDIFELILKGKNQGSGLSATMLDKLLNKHQLFNDVLMASTAPDENGDDRSVYRQYSDGLYANYIRYAANAIRDRFNKQNPDSQISHDFANDDTPIAGLGIAMLAAKPETAVDDYLSLFKDQNLITSWSDDYLYNQVARYDNMGASLSAGFGFYDIRAGFITGAQGISRDNYFNDLFALDLKAARDAVSYYRGQQAAISEAVANSLTNLNRKGK